MTTSKKTNHSQQKSSEGQTISDNVGSSRNSMHRKVLATSESNAYGLQAGRSRPNYKITSNMETTGDVRLKSAKVVSLLNDETSRCSKNPADKNIQKKHQWWCGQKQDISLPCTCMDSWKEQEIRNQTLAEVEKMFKTKFNEMNKYKFCHVGDYYMEIDKKLNELGELEK